MNQSRLTPSTWVNVQVQDGAEPARMQLGSLDALVRAGKVSGETLVQLAPQGAWARAREILATMGGRPRQSRLWLWLGVGAGTAGVIVLGAGLAIWLLTRDRADPQKAAIFEQRCLDGIETNTSGDSCNKACDYGSAKGCIQVGDFIGLGSWMDMNPDGVYAGRQQTIKGCKLQGDSEETCSALAKYDASYTQKLPEELQTCVKAASHSEATDCFARFQAKWGSK